MTIARWQIWVVYAVLTIIGSVTIAVRTIRHYPRFSMPVRGWRVGVLDGSRIGYVATRAIPRNHRFVDADLVRPKLPASVAVNAPNVSGRYAVKAFAKGAVVQPGDTESTPFVTAPVPRTTIVVPVPPELVNSGAIDAGTNVAIVFGKNSISATVEAIVGAKSDSAIVSVSRADALSFINRDPKATPTLLP